MISRLGADVAAFVARGETDKARALQEAIGKLLAPPAGGHSKRPCVLDLEEERKRWKR